MLSISRRMSGNTRPRDLHLITGGARLDRLKHDQSQFPHAPLSCESDSHVLQSSFKSPAESSDTTQWPCPPRQTQKPIQRRRAASLSEISTAPLNETITHVLGNEQPHGMLTSFPDAPFLVRSGPQLRGFHTSSRAPYESASYNATDVPEFFIKYKQHRSASFTDMGQHERKREVLGLMHSLANSVLSGDVVATTRRLNSKIPVEHKSSEGRVIHPSGFVVPGPGHISTSDVARAKERERDEKKDRAAQTVAVAHRVLESDLEQVNATTLPLVQKVPFEVREPDGIVKHPSGFVPPTPAHKFKYTVNTSVLRDRKVSAVRQSFRQPPPPRGVLRAVHTTSAQKVSQDL